MSSSGPKQHPDDWQKVWQLIEDKWDKDEPCPEGALKPFNIDAKLNGAYVALGLLYGGRDFGKTIEIATRTGQDSDCNPASAGGILGVMLGYQAIPDEWKSGIPAIADKKFSYTDFTFHTINDSTEKRTLALIQKTGGRIEGDKVFVKTQSPKAPKLEAWNDYGKPVERIAIDNPAWQWKGDLEAQPPDEGLPAKKEPRPQFSFRAPASSLPVPIGPTAAPPTSTSTANSSRPSTSSPTRIPSKTARVCFTRSTSRTPNTPCDWLCAANPIPARKEPTSALPI